MAVTTVAQFATELNRPAAALLEQLLSAGVAKKSTDDALTETDKERLLEFLRSSHGTSGTERKKITLVRKSTSEIKQADASGKARTIQVEVRKKRVFVKRDDVAPGIDEAAAAAAAEAEQADLQRREAEAQAQAEAIRMQEAELAERRRLREEQERAEHAAAEARAREQAAVAAAAAAAAAALPAVAKKDDKAPVAAAPASAPEPVAEAPKPALRVIKASTIEAEDKQRQADLDRRRKVAETEAAAIRAMMNAPKKVLLAKAPETPKPGDATKEGITGTIHKPKAAPGAATTAAKPGDKKALKSEKLSSSWADDAAKKRALKPRTDGGASGRPGWRAPRGSRRGDHREGSSSGYVAPAETTVQEVHVPETISVADLAHKMSVKASELIKHLMKLGQMVTINQQLEPGDRDDPGGGNGSHRAGRQARRSGSLPRGRRSRDHGRGPAARAGGHRDGPRRPRQDLVARPTSAAPASLRARPAASPSTSVRTTSNTRAA